MFCFCLSLGAEVLREVPVLDNVNRQYWWRSSLCLDVNNSGPNRPSGVLYPVELVDNLRVVNATLVTPPPPQTWASQALFFRFLTSFFNLKNDFFHKSSLMVVLSPKNISFIFGNFSLKDIFVICAPLYLD